MFTFVNNSTRFMMKYIEVVTYLLMIQHWDVVNHRESQVPFACNQLHCQLHTSVSLGKNSELSIVHINAFHLLYEESVVILSPNS